MKWTLSANKKMMICASVGLMAAYLGWSSLRRAEKRMKSQYSMTTVLQAKKYLKEGKRLDGSTVEEVPIPVAYLPPTALQKKEELLDARGEPLYQVRTPLLKGEIVAKSRVVDVSSDRNLAWSLSPGQTALTIKLSPEQSVGSWLEPGDFVNVYGTFDQQPGVSNDQTQLILARKQVLAVDGCAWEVDKVVSQKPNEGVASLEFRFVTLALSPNEAGMMVLAADKGRIVLSLISPLDTQIHKMRSIHLADLR